MTHRMINAGHSTSFVLALLISLTVLFAACSDNRTAQRPRTPSMNQRQTLIASETALVKSGAQAIPVATEIETLFPVCDHFISQDSRGQKSRLWNTEAFVAGRYVLTMQVSVMVGDRNHSVVPTGQYAFFLKEVTNVTRLGDGRVSAWFGSQKTFDLEAWKTAGQDPSIEILLKSVGMRFNRSPVKDFEMYVQAIRKDRIPITLVDVRTKGDASRSKKNVESCDTVPKNGPPRAGSG